MRKGTKYEYEIIDHTTYDTLKGVIFYDPSEDQFNRDLRTYFYIFQGHDAEENLANLIDDVKAGIVHFGSGYDDSSDLNGSIKWDGCSDFYSSCCHICDLDMFDSLTKLYKQIYNRSLEILGYED